MSRRGDPQDLPGGPAGRVVEQLAELREAELDEADEALADLGLLGHQGHREAGGLTQLDPCQRVASRWAVAHGHLGETPGIGRVGLRAGEPALGKVLRRERVDHRDRDVAPAEVRGERHPVMAGGLHRHERHRLGLSLEPAVEAGKAGSVLADPDDLPVGARLAVPTARHHVRPSADVDPDRHHPGHAPSTDPRGARSLRSTSADRFRSPVDAAGSRSPFTAGGRGPDTNANGHLPDSIAPVSPWRSTPSSTPTRSYISIRHPRRREMRPGFADDARSRAQAIGARSRHGVHVSPRCETVDAGSLSAPWLVCVMPLWGAPIAWPKAEDG